MKGTPSNILAPLNMADMKEAGDRSVSLWDLQWEAADKQLWKLWEHNTRTRTNPGWQKDSVFYNH